MITDDHIAVDVAGDEPHTFDATNCVATLWSAGSALRKIDAHRSIDSEIKNGVELRTASQAVMSKTSNNSFVGTTSCEERVASFITKQRVACTPCMDGVGTCASPQDVAPPSSDQTVTFSVSGYGVVVSTAADEVSSTLSVDFVVAL